MWLVRAVQTRDLERLLELIGLATQGLTSLQLDRDRLLERVEQSVFAFGRTGLSPRGEPFVLVMVDSETDEIVGTSTVYAKTGGYQPFYAYRIVESEHQSQQLDVRTVRKRLELERTHDGPTEIGSLFLRKKSRGQGRGRWLSMARFAIIADKPHRFADRVIAEMRGRATDDGMVPFWEAVTGRFLPTDFSIADTLSTVCKRFIEELMPQHPIYLDLLPEEVREILGQVHRETEPALGLLQQEGFRRTNQIDIFDGGPVVSCITSEISAVKRCRRVTVRKVVDILERRPCRAILASTKNDFTSTLQSFVLDGDEVTIDASTAESLGIESGSQATYLTLSD